MDYAMYLMEVMDALYVNASGTTFPVVSNPFLVLSIRSSTPQILELRLSRLCLSGLCLSGLCLSDIPRKGRAEAPLHLPVPNGREEDGEIYGFDGLDAIATLGT